LAQAEVAEAVALRLERLETEPQWRAAALAVVVAAGYSCRTFMCQTRVIPLALARAELVALPRSSI